MTGTAGICALGAASSLLRGLDRGLAVCLASTILGGMRAYPAGAKLQSEFADVPV